MGQYRTAVTLKIGEREVEGEVSTISPDGFLIRYPETCLFWGKRADMLSGSEVIGYPTEDESLWDHHTRMVTEVNEGKHTPWVERGY